MLQYSPFASTLRTTEDFLFADQYVVTITAQKTEKGSISVGFGLATKVSGNALPGEGIDGPLMDLSVQVHGSCGSGMIGGER